MIEAKIIAIMGAPRSGKSFLVQKLAAATGWPAFIEGHNDTFPAFIEEDIRNNTNSLRRILWFRNRQISHFLEALELRKNGKGVLLDTFWIDNQMYIDVLLGGHDRDIVQEIIRLDRQILKWPDIIVYLKNSEDRTKEFIAAGGRDFDASEGFFQNVIVPLQKQYDAIFALVPPSTKLVVLDRSTLDFEKTEDLETLMKRISSL